MNCDGCGMKNPTSRTVYRDNAIRVIFCLMCNMAAIDFNGGTMSPIDALRFVAVRRPERKT